ncbi:MAG: hypothetical protein ACLTSX_05630 [Collinsella sp.]
MRGRYFKIHLTDIYFSATLFDFYEVHEPGLEAEPLRFKPMEVGQPVEALPIELVNTSKAEVTIESVTVDSDAFVVTKGIPRWLPRDRFELEDFSGCGHRGRHA